MESVIGPKAKLESNTTTDAKMMLENGPAANTASCSLAGLFLISCSSGSTKAKGISGMTKWKNAKPLAFTFIPNALAVAPWANSCTVAIRKMEIMK